MAVLDGALNRQDADAARTAVTALLGIYAKGRQGEEDARMMVGGYLAVLRDLPAFAILGACAAWARGEAAGQRPGWAPATDELRTAAMAILRPYQWERAKLDQFLRAKEVDDRPTSQEERARIIAGFEKVKAELAVSAEIAARMKQGGQAQ